MDRDEGDISRTRATSVCIAYGARSFTGFQRYPLLRWRSRKFVEEIGFENLEPAFITLQEVSKQSLPLRQGLTI